MTQAMSVPISQEVMADQKRKLVEEYDMSEEEAEQVYKSMKTQVMLMAQSAERDWEKDEYEAVTDVLMGIQHQQAEMVEEMQQSRMAKIARYLPVALLVTGLVGLVTGVGTVVATGPTLVSDVLIVVSMVTAFASVILS